MNDSEQQHPDVRRVEYIILQDSLLHLPPGLLLALPINCTILSRSHRRNDFQASKSRKYMLNNQQSL